MLTLVADLSVSAGLRIADSLGHIIPSLQQLCPVSDLQQRSDVPEDTMLLWEFCLQVCLVAGLSCSIIAHTNLTCPHAADIRVPAVPLPASSHRLHQGYPDHRGGFHAVRPQLRGCRQQAGWRHA